MILILILACEIGFWLAIIAGLFARYVLRRPRLGAALLIAAPAIDVVLLVLVTVDLLGGGTASWQHGLAAIYLGFSVAFGHQLISWADVRFAHRFSSGPAPRRLAGIPYTVKCWKDVLRTLLMAAIAAGITGVLMLIADDAESTAELAGTFRIIGIVLAVDVLWALSYTIWPKKQDPRPLAVED